MWAGLRKPTLSVRGPLLLTAGTLGLVVILALLQALPRGTIRTDCGAEAAPGVNWNTCDRSGERFDHLDLSRARARSARLDAAGFSAGVLRDTDFSYADLSGADLSLADLRGARLTGANLQGANLAHALLNGADLRFADLREARLDGTDLTEATLDEALWTDGHVCARGSRGRCVRR